MNAPGQTNGSMSSNQSGNGDTRRHVHPNLPSDYVLANPPFNDSDWFRKDDAVRFLPICGISKSL